MKKYARFFPSLRLWGAYPKILYLTQTLQLGKDALLYPSMQSYPPGMALLCYFMTSFSPEFSESTLYVTYGFFGLCLLFPLLGDVQWKDKKTLIPVFLLILFLPRLVTGLSDDDGSYYYSSLYIDIPLGICCGYCFFHAFRFPDTDPFEKVCTVLSFCALVLLKDSGSFFALCGLLVMIIHSIRGQKNHLFINLIWILAAAAVLLFGWGSWKYLLGNYGVTNHLAAKFTMPSLSNLAYFFLYFLKTPVTGIYSLTGTISFSLPAILLTVFLFRLFLLCGNKNISFSHEIINLTIELICYIGFFLGYYFTYQGTILDQYYPSYVRYMCTLVMCSAYILVFELRFVHRDLLLGIQKAFSEAISRNCPSKKLITYSKTLIHGLILIGLVFNTALILLDFPDKNKGTYEKSHSAAQFLKSNISQPQEDFADVYMVIPYDSETDTKLHHLVYLDLLDDHIFIRNYQLEVDITTGYLCYTPEEFLQILKNDGYEYVYIPQMSEMLHAEFASLFSDTEVTDSQLLYRFDPQTHQLTRIHES